MWRLLIVNHLDQSLWLANQKYKAKMISYLLHSFLACVKLCCAFYWCQKNVKMLGQNHFVNPNKHVLIFFHHILIHIQSIGGVILIALPYMPFPSKNMNAFDLLCRRNPSTYPNFLHTIPPPPPLGILSWLGSKRA
jgi:hypothetical protein